jgi:hypothetical protein
MPTRDRPKPAPESQAQLARVAIQRVASVVARPSGFQGAAVERVRATIRTESGASGSRLRPQNPEPPSDPLAKRERLPSSVDETPTLPSLPGEEER